MKSQRRFAPTGGEFSPESVAYMFRMVPWGRAQGRNRRLSLEERAMSISRMPPIHPGEVLLEEFLKPMGISQYRLAKDISVSPRRINEIVHGKRAITADTALRLSQYFRTSERFWMNLQTRYDLEMVKDRLGDRLAKEIHARVAG